MPLIKSADCGKKSPDTLTPVYIADRRRSDLVKVEKNRGLDRASSNGAVFGFLIGLVCTENPIRVDDAPESPKLAE
jgi:hypothetical protein